LVNENSPNGFMSQGGDEKNKIGEQYLDKTK